MDTLARAPGGQMRGAATKAVSDIVEDLELRSGRAPLPRSGTGPAGPSPCSHGRLSMTLATDIPHRVLLVARASPAGSRFAGQQGVHIISAQTLTASAG